MCAVICPPNSMEGRPEDYSGDFNVRPVELRASAGILGCTGAVVGWMENRYAQGCGTEWYNLLW